MVSFCKQNKMFEVVWRKSYYRRRNPKRKNKSPIEAGDMEKVKSHFKNFFGSICAIIWAREKGRVGKNSQRTHRNSSKTIPRICQHKVHRTVQELPRWHSTEGSKLHWRENVRNTWLATKSQIPFSDKIWQVGETVGTRTNAWKRIQSPNWCPKDRKWLPFSKYTTIIVHEPL